LNGGILLKVKIVDRIYKPCNACALNCKNEVIFYDNLHNKANIKVMVIFEQPGGRFGDDDDYIKNYSPEQKAEYHRGTFPSWLAKYYTYNMEIFRNLKKYNYITQDLRYFENAMDEVYFTDAIKCRVEGKSREMEGEAEKERGSTKANYKTCTDEYLGQEIEELPNLELIIACGNKALNSLRYLSKKNKSKIEISKKPTKSYRNQSNPDQTFAHGDVYEFEYNGRPIKVIHFAHPSFIYSRKVKEIKPIIRENEFLKKVCDFVFNTVS
jgi:uracil-DNA glycosylase